MERQVCGVVAHRKWKDLTREQISAPVLIMSTLPETALYAPVRDWLLRAGWEVRAEVRDCDVVARKGDDLVVVELKRQAGIRLLEQALDRQRITPAVYVAVPAQAIPKRRRAAARLFRLLRRLELGLLVVDLVAQPPRLSVLFHPLPHKPRREKRRRVAVVEEMDGRSQNANTGGSTGRKRLTAYREQALYIACCMQRFGPLSPRKCRDLGACEKAGGILYSNFYGWFERVEKGVYTLSAAGLDGLAQWPQIVAGLREKLAQHPECREREGNVVKMD